MARLQRRSQRHIASQPSGAHQIVQPIAVEIEMVDEEADRDPQHLRPTELCLGDERAVLEAMTMVLSGVGLQARGHRIEHPVNGALALHVHRHLKAPAMVVGEERLEVAWRVPELGHMAVG